MPKTLTTDEFIARAIERYGDDYDYSRVVYVNSKSKIKLACSKGHKYQQQAGKHMTGTGCPKCADIRKKEMAESWYTERNVKKQ